MFDEDLDYLLQAQIGYLSIHLKNLTTQLKKKEVSRRDIIAEDTALNRFAMIYCKKHGFDNIIITAWQNKFEKSIEIPSIVIKEVVQA